MSNLLLMYDSTRKVIRKGAYSESLDCDPDKVSFNTTAMVPVFISLKLGEISLQEAVDKYISYHKYRG